MKNNSFLLSSELRSRCAEAAKKERPRKKADAELLDTLDAVLEQVQGSYVCAAKLLDMTYERLKNLVNGNPLLKAKWGKGLGRPPGLKFQVRIKPYVAPMPYLEPWRGDLLEEAKSLILKHLSPAELDELALWLDWVRSQRDLKREDQKSPTELKADKAA